MTPTEAIILAGGKGTRLQPAVSEVPKPMAPIGKRPFLEYQLNYLQSYGIEHVILSVGYKWQLIRDYFGDTYRSMSISYSVEETPLGTGGAIARAMSELYGSHTYILNGDTFFEVNLKDLSEFYFAHKPDIALTVKRMKDFFRYGTVELDVCRVTAFREKQPVSHGLINGGVYITGQDLFVPFDLPETFSLEKDFLEKNISNLKICAMTSGEYFIDIGLPSDYEKAKAELPGKITAG